jgi:hypothetical protein
MPYCYQSHQTQQEGQTLVAQHDSTASRPTRQPRQRGRHLARRLRGPVTETEAVQWRPSAVVEAHTGPIAIEDPATRLLRLRAIRDHLALPDPA